MTFLPVVERELRAGARKNSVRYIRVGVAAVALVLSLGQLLALTFAPAGTAGHAGFTVMTGYALVVSLLAGVFIAADTLSEEKRAGTLGLLFLTDLRGYDVVLGKGAAQFLTLGYALLAILPSAALPLLIGGVTGGEVWRVSLALVNVLFFALAAGLLASALCRTAGNAMSVAALIVLALCAGWPLLAAAVNATAPATGGWLGWSPMQAFLQARDAAHQLNPTRFWTTLGLSHLLGWLLLAWASWWLPRSWQDRPQVAATPGSSPHSTSPGELPTRDGPRIRRRRELLDAEPLAWLIGERFGARLIAWGIAIVWSVWTLGCAFVGGEGWIVSVILSGWLAMFLLKLLFVAQACSFFAECRRTGAFELLLAAPIASRELVSAQWRSLRRIFLPPLVLMLAVAVLYAIATAVRTLSKPEELWIAWGVGFVVPVLVLLSLLLDFFALGWLGMWLALTMRKPHYATGATILFVLILPNVILCYGSIVSVVLNIILIAVYSSRLREDFRPRVLEQRGTA